MKKYLCFDVALNEMYSLLKLQEQYPQHKCLFEGTRDEKIWDAAPWLFEIDENVFNTQDKFLSLKACVIFETSVKLEELCTHLQQFINKKRDGKEYFFRFWDARVLEEYLKSSNEKQLEIFFEEIENIYTESEEEQYLKKMSLSRYNRLVTENISTSQCFHTKAATDNKIAPTAINAIDNKEENSDEEKKEKPERRKFFID